MPELIKIGLLLQKKDRDHLGLPTSDNEFTIGNYQFKTINENVSIKKQGSFHLIIHKISDFVKSSKKGNEQSQRILRELLNYSDFCKICMDNPFTVLELADRNKMFQMMNRLKFQLDNYIIDVPKWISVVSKSDLDLLKSQKLAFPIICKALCAGEGPGGHSMQLLFNPQQLESLDVFPCIAQEFKNHDSYMVKIFVFGPNYYVCTRPSVRNFPVNGCSVENNESIRFDSHEVAKLCSKTFLNNFQEGFVLRSSMNGDQILSDKVVKVLLSKISKEIDSNILGIDIIITGSHNNIYNLVDINYLPSFDGVADRRDIILRMIGDYINSGRIVHYWT